MLSDLVIELFAMLLGAGDGRKWRIFRVIALSLAVLASGVAVVILLR
jgi:hypothetical protein